MATGQGVTACAARDVGDGHTPGLQRVIEHWGRGRERPEGCQEPGVLLQDMAAMTAARGTPPLVVAHRSSEGGRTMKFGLMYETQISEPHYDGIEQERYHQVMAQVELADAVGFEYVWTNDLG